MLGTLLAKVIGTQNERELKRLRPLVDQVNAFEASTKQLSDDQLRAKTDEFRERLAKGETLERPACPRPSRSFARLDGGC